ncbi:MAG: class I SAM-dependent methyltransferase [Bacteroidota bacterium]
MIIQSASHLWKDKGIRAGFSAALDELDQQSYIPANSRDQKRNAGNNLNTTFGKWLWCCVRVFKPLHMVETGVAHGASSWIILNAMRLNGRGTLHSIDLPNLDTNQDYNFGTQSAETGWMVPDVLKANWDLRLGDAKTLLPALLKELGQIDIFFHDSDHSAEHMKFEFDQAEKHLRLGGLLLSDDIDKNSAFDAFSDRTGWPHVIFGKGGCALSTRTT